MSKMQISEHEVPLALEDRFVVVGIREARQICPSGDDGEALSEAMGHASEFLGELTPVFDLRGLRTLYNDVFDFMQEVKLGWKDEAHVLVTPEEAGQLDLELLKRTGFKI